MLRQAQHEREILCNFNPKPVHPEPVEGRMRSISKRSIIEPVLSYVMAAYEAANPFTYLIKSRICSSLRIP